MSGIGGLSENRMLRLIGPLIKEAEKESKNRKKQQRKKNMVKNASKTFFVYDYDF